MNLEQLRFVILVLIPCIRAIRINIEDSTEESTNESKPFNSTVIKYTSEGQIYLNELDYDIYPNYGTDWIYYPTDEEKYKIRFLNGSLRDRVVKDVSSIWWLHDAKNYVKFFLYNKDNSSQKGIYLPPNIYGLASKKFNPNKTTKILIHGYKGSHRADYMQLIKDEYLNENDYNIILVDFSSIAVNNFYLLPLLASRSIGEYCGKFFDKLLEFGVKAEDVHVIGHSLGAHIAGFAGQAMKNGKVQRITALDAALPGFYVILVLGGRLSVDSAQFVDAIHTCSGLYGLADAIGRADFYPNGGWAPQPGCFNEPNLNFNDCSHGRSWQFFLSSISTEEPYIAYRCDDYKQFLNGICGDEETDIMGEGITTSANGTYYLKTSEMLPYF